MENIINDIVNIDAMAQVRLAQAHELQEQYKRELAEKINETNRALSQEEKTRIETVLKTETEIAEKEKLLLSSAREEALKILESAFEENHESLEAAMFENVINGVH